MSLGWGRGGADAMEETLLALVLVGKVRSIEIDSDPVEDADLPERRLTSQTN